jgi:hypothetical protein
MSAFTDRSLSLSFRFYKGLLRAYPQPFREEFDDLLCQAFGDLAHRAVRTKGIWGLIVLWLRTVPDLISSALNQRFLPDSDWRFRVRWIIACSSGVLVAVICIIGLPLLIHLTKMRLGLLPANPHFLVPIVRRPEPGLWTNLRVLRDAAVLGIILGLFQSLALEWDRSRRVAWILATTIGTTVGAASLLTIPFLANYLTVTIHPWRFIVEQHPAFYYGGGALFCVSIVGSLQVFVLAKRNMRSLLWIPTSAAAILACALLMPFGVPGLTEGIIYGILTVLPLEWILRRETETLRTSENGGASIRSRHL